MNVQKRTGQNIGRLRRLMLAVFALCFFVSVALLGGFGAGTGGAVDGLKYADEGNTHLEWNKYNDSQLMGGLGDGVDADTAWLIGNATQLNDLANQVNGAGSYLSALNLSGKFIKLTANIDLSEFGATFNGGAGWVPIGNYSTTSIYFAGNLDGGGFTVSNLYINITSTASIYAGLFGYMGPATAIKNLGVSGSVTVNSTGMSLIGGIAGGGGTSITDCYSAVNLSATSSSSGSGVTYVGGMLGSSSCTITNCYNIGSVTAISTGAGSNSNAIAGGIVGSNGGAISNCYNMGTISATSTNNAVGQAGGIVARSFQVQATIRNCYNTGAVSATGVTAAYVGGIIGYVYGNATLNTSYSAATVNGTSVGTVYKGGIVGYLQVGSATTSYFNSDKFAGNAVGSNAATLPAAGLTAAQMTNNTLATNMSALNAGAFIKRPNTGTTLYYPELDIFYNSATAAVMEASRISVATTLLGNPFYTISYNLNGGTNAANPATYTTEDTIELLSPTRDGYAFMGWYETGLFSGDAVTDIPAGSAGHKTFYAKWKFIYNITYHLNDGTNAERNQDTYLEQNDTIALLEPTRHGYVFFGWYEDELFAGDEVTEIAANSTEDKEFWARWTPEYTITYHLNEGENSENNPDKYTTESARITLEEPTRAGYTFGGWYTNAGLTDAATPIDTGSTGNKEFWASWSLTEFTITYNNVNEAANTNRTTYTIESAVTLVPLGPRAGYTFDGWFANAELTEAATPINAGSTGNKAFWARWSLTEYTITYNNVNEAANDNRTIYTIETATIPLAALGARAGYIFGGWFGAEDFSGGAVTNIETGSFGDKIFYAKWNLIYTITYRLNDGKNNDGNPNIYTEEDAITLENPTRGGYVFGGWFVTADFSGAAVTGIKVGTTGNKTFYAKWTAIAGDGGGGGNTTIYILGGCAAVFLLVAISMARRSRRKKRAAAAAQTYMQNDYDYDYDQYGYDYQQYEQNPYEYGQYESEQYLPPNPYGQPEAYGQDQYEAESYGQDQYEAQAYEQDQYEAQAYEQSNELYGQPESYELPNPYDPNDPNEPPK
jgi:uncharacterized repeat protein (TIGR02543 family)